MSLSQILSDLTGPFADEVAQSRSTFEGASVLTELVCEQWQSPSGASVITGAVRVEGTMNITPGSHVLILGSVHCTDLLMGANSTLIVQNEVRCARLLRCAQSDAVTQVWGDVYARFIWSGHSMGSLSARGNKVVAELIDDHVGTRGATIEAPHVGSNAFLSQLCPDAMTLAKWEDLSEDQVPDAARQIGIDPEGIDPDELFDLGMDKLDSAGWDQSSQLLADIQAGVYDQS